MNNLLPVIKPTITHRAEDKNLSWRPADAHPKTGKVPYFLESEFTKKSTIKILYGQNVLPTKPPNEKYIESNIFPHDESPLKAALSEVPDKPRVIFVPPPSLTRKTIIKDMSNGNCLMLKMINTLPLCMDLFVQKKLTMLTTTVLPMRQCIRLIAGIEDENNREDQTCFWFCSSKRAVMTSTNRQELRDFSFSTTSQIGLEVEAVDDKLVVMQVLPHSQATRFELQLMGADVIAINGTRIINMSEFREAMLQAKANKADIVLKVASYKGGKGKLDSLYSHDFTKNKEVKSLLSNIMMHGLDAEHHRGLLSAEGSVREEDEEEEDEDDKPSQEMNRIHIDGWENLEEYPDVESLLPDLEKDVDDSMSAAVSEEGGMKAKKRNHVTFQSHSRQRSRANSESDDDAISAGSSAKSVDSWNALTKVEEIVTRRSIVCFPLDLSSPHSWGAPAKHLQVSNYGSQWHLEVAWINEDNILVHKGDVPPGNTDYQRWDVGQVWCIIARPVATDNGHHHHEPIHHFSDGEALGYGTAAAAEEGSPAMLTIRPSKYSLSPNKCTSVLWSPYASMSITQRLYMTNKDGEATATFGAADNLPNYTATPHMHIQIFDGVRKPVKDQDLNIGDSVPLDRLKLSKWPRKGNSKREKALKSLRK